MNTPENGAIYILLLILILLLVLLLLVQRLKCNVYNVRELSSLIMSIFILILFFIMNLLKQKP